MKVLIGFSYLFLAFLISCSHVSLLNKADPNKASEVSDSQGVEFTPPEVESQSQVSSEEPARIKTEETVNLLEGKVHVDNRDGRESRTSAKKIKLGLIMAPGLNRSVGHIGVLRNLDRAGVNVDIISGTEFGAIIGAMYASGQTPEMIEWNFYKYFREKKNYKMLTKKWIDEIDQFFLKRLANLRVEKLKRSFYVPLYSNAASKVVYFNKGNLRNLLILNLMTVKDASTVEYLSASNHEIFSQQFMKSSGADMVVGLDPLGDKIIWAKSDSLLQDTYAKYSNQIKKEKKALDLYYSLKLDSAMLDSDEEAGANLQNSLDYSQKLVQEIKKLKEARARVLDEARAEPYEDTN